MNNESRAASWVWLWVVTFVLGGCACPAARALDQPRSEDPCKSTIQQSNAAIIPTSNDSAAEHSAALGDFRAQNHPSSPPSQSNTGSETAETVKLKGDLKKTQESLRSLENEETIIVGTCRTFELKLSDANAQAQSLNDQIAKLKKGQSLTPTGFLGDMSWLILSASALLSLLAILYVFDSRRRMKRMLSTAIKAAGDLTSKLSQAENSLSARKSFEEKATSRSAVGVASTERSLSGSESPLENRIKPAGSDSRLSYANRLDPRERSAIDNASQTPIKSIGPLRPTERPESSGETGRVAAASNRDQTSEPKVKLISPATTVRRTPEPSADPMKATGDIVIDYNKARAMGNDAGEWFKSKYEWMGLSCNNSNDRVLDPNVLPLFQEEPRGSFLGVFHKGEMRLVPALDKELEVSASILKDAFDYPPQTTGRLALLRAATIEKNGGLWQLRQSGEITIER